MTQVIPPDMELWACTYLRGHLKDVAGLKVSNREPDGYDGSYPIIIVRDDGGSQSDRIVFDRQLGVNVRMGPRSRPKPCRDLAARVYGLLTDPDITLQADCPVAAITWDGCNGPYPVSEDSDIARYYLIAEYSAVGTIQNQ